MLALERIIAVIGFFFTNGKEKGGGEITSVVVTAPSTIAGTNDVFVFSSLDFIGSGTSD